MEELDYYRNFIEDATWQKLRPSHNEVFAFIYKIKYIDIDDLVNDLCILD